MSTITIKINTIGDVVKNNLTFTPSMIDPEMKATTIYMPPTFRLSESLIKKAVKDSSSVKEILTTPSMFHSLVRYSTDRAKGYKKITLQQAEQSGIIKSNYKFMQQLWLKKGKRIFIDDRAYDIITSTIKNTTMPNSSKNLQFKIDIDLRVIQSKRNNLVNRTKMSCDDKRENINQIYEDLYGVPFFNYRDPSLKQSAAPVMYSGPKTGIATARSPGKTKQPKQTNPFAPYGNKVQGVAPYGMMPAAVPIAYAIPQPQPQPGKTTTGGTRKNKTYIKKRKQKVRSTRFNTLKRRV